MSFVKAERKQAKIKLAVCGPSGSGKTYSALLLASGLGKKLAVVDTENGSASLYSDLVPFDVMELKPPFTTEAYRAAIKQAVEGGYDVLVVDSLTHVWSGEGGLLDQKNVLDSRGGNGYVNWKTITPKLEALVSDILHSDIHLLACMRSKQEYILQANDKGKQEPHKVGMAPIMRDGVEYEFTTVFDIAMDHSAVVSKDRTGLFEGQTFRVTKETGKEIVRWLDSASLRVPPVSTPAVGPPAAGSVVPVPAALSLSSLLDQIAACDSAAKLVSLRDKFQGVADHIDTASLAELRGAYKQRARELGVAPQ